jgi:hypothetical protein
VDRRSQTLSSADKCSKRRKTETPSRSFALYENLAGFTGEAGDCRRIVVARA